MPFSLGIIEGIGSITTWYLFFFFDAMKAAKITYWISTIALALFILPGLFFMNSPEAVEGMSKVGLTSAVWLQQLVWFGAPLAILLILIPGVWNRLKEWSYVWIGCIYIGAFWAHISIDGLANPMTYAPVVAFAILLTSYLAWHKILKARGETL